jgi:hypothetical protein
MKGKRGKGIGRREGEREGGRGGGRGGGHAEGKLFKEGVEWKERGEEGQGGTREREGRDTGWDEMVYDVHRHPQYRPTAT